MRFPSGKAKSIRTAIAGVVMKWTIVTTLASLCLAIPFLIHLVIESADRQMKTVAETSVRAFAPLIRSGAVKEAEKEMRAAFRLRSDEQMIVLDTSLAPIYLRDKEVQSPEEIRPLVCNGKPGYCWNAAHTYLSALVPIYFDQDEKQLLGYLGIRMRAPVDVILIIGLTVMVLCLQLFSAGGIVLRLGSLAQEISKNLEDWSRILKTDPKAKHECAEVPYLELTEMQEAISGLHVEIARLEASAGNRAQLTLLRGLAHDIVAPALKLSKMVAILRKSEGAPTTPKRTELLARIQNETHLLTRLANEVKFMRELSDRSEAWLKERHCDLNQELSALVTDLEKDDEVANLRLTIKLSTPAAPSAAAISPSDCYRIFSNLVRNAIQASNAGGEISVEVALNNGRPTVAVRDHGSGMTPEIRNRIFDLDFTTKERTGTGLGLPIVKYLCDFNNATIDVESSTGVGSEFVVRFEAPVTVQKVGGVRDLMTAPMQA